MFVEVELVDNGGNRYRITGPEETVAAFVARALRKGAAFPENRAPCARSKRRGWRRPPRDRHSRRTPRQSRPDSATDFAEGAD